MEFWGVEVQAGKPLTVFPEEGNLIHISQASLECKGKKGEPVLLSVKVDGKKFVIGTLYHENIPQISFDLVFEKEFELFHNLDNGSVHFIGYKSPNIDQEEGDYFSDSEEEEEEEVPAAVTANGNSGAAVSNVVKANSEPKAKPAEVKPAEVKPESEDDDDEDSDEEDDSEDDGSDSEKGMDVDEDDSDDDEDDDEDEEETPQKPEPINKKRANESASKTPVSAKKAKPAPAAAASTPQKTGEKKKGGHTATPHPAKKGGKTPMNANQSPKSGGQSSGGSNKKPFNSGKQFGSNNKGKGKGKGRA